MPKRNTIVVPCIEKIWLYASGLRNPISGRRSCVRMSTAKTTAMRKNTSAVPMYIRPIFLWSVVVSQAPRPSRSAWAARRRSRRRAHLSSSR